MKVTRLNEVADFDYGFAFDSKKFNAEGEGLPLVRIRDVLPGRSKTYYSGAYSDRYLVQDADFLIGMDGQFNLSQWQRGRALLNQRVCRIGDLAASVDRAYLARFMSLALKTSEDATPFVTVKHLSAKALNAIEILLPPFEEQRRIAAILDHADAIRTKRRQQVAYVDSMASSLFLDMFGDPARNPRDLRTAQLGSLATKFSDGPFGSNLKSSHYTESGVPVIRLQNIGVGEYKSTACTFVSEAHYSGLRKHDCRPGDVLIGTLGEPNIRACIQPTSLPLALNKADCVQMRVDESQVHAEYVVGLLNSPGTLAPANSLILGQTRARVSMGRLRTLVVPVPSIDEQRRYAARIQEIASLREIALGASRCDDQLSASLQSRAFKGEL